MALMMLADRGGVATIPENDGLGAVTQLMVRCLTGQVGAYFEFYEFIARPPADRRAGLRPRRSGRRSGAGDAWPNSASFPKACLNVSKVKTGRVTLCRLASRGDRYRMHIVTGQAVSPGTWEEAGWAQPAPQLPSLEVVLDTPVDDFAQKVLGQHYILAYGDQRAATRRPVQVVRNRGHLTR